MGLQKYRADKQGEKQKNGGTVWYAQWFGGPTLALIRECKIVHDMPSEITPRTVYITGEADTWFSIPAACKLKGKVLRGYVACDDNGEYYFRAHKTNPIV